MNFKRIALTVIVCGSSLVYAKPTYLKSPEDYHSCFNSSKPMITFYTGPSCGPCRVMKPDFYTVSRNHPDIEFHIIDITKRSMKGIVQNLTIQSIPTLILSCNGKVIARTRGCLSKREIEQEITHFKNTLSKRSSKAKETSKEATTKQTSPHKNSKKSRSQK